MAITVRDVEQALAHAAKNRPGLEVRYDDGEWIARAFDYDSSGPNGFAWVDINLSRMAVDVERYLS